MSLDPENFEELYEEVEDTERKLKENTVKGFYSLHQYKWHKRETPLQKLMLYLYDYCKLGRDLDEDTRINLENEIKNMMDDNMTKTSISRAIAF